MSAAVHWLLLSERRTLTRLPSRPRRFALSVATGIVKTMVAADIRRYALGCGAAHERRPARLPESARPGRVPLPH